MTLCGHLGLELNAVKPQGGTLDAGLAACPATEQRQASLHMVPTLSKEDQSDSSAPTGLEDVRASGVELL